MRVFGRNDKSFLSKWFYQVDRKLFAFVFALIAIGIIMLIAAGSFAAARIGQPPMYFLVKSIVPMILGISGMLFFSALSKKWIIRLSFLGAIVAAILIFGTLVNPTVIKGSSRFLNLGGFMIHPSELLKPFFIVVSAVFLAHVSSISPGKFFLTRKTWSMKNWGWQYFLIPVGMTLLVVFAQPDFGMTLIFCAVFAAMLFFAGTSLKSVAAMFGGVLALGGIAFAVMPHVRNRILGNSDPFQLNKALDSIRNGGFLGKSNSSFVKSDLPDSHTDFVFSALVEDRGILFGIGLLAIYLALLCYILKQMQTIKDTTTRLVCGGTVGLVAVQTMLNVGTAIGMPSKGTVLPFVSYGGTAFMSMCIVFGIMVGMIRSYKYDKE